MPGLVGVILILLSGTAFAFMAVFRGWATDAGANTHTVLALRFALAAAVLWPIVLVQRRRIPRGTPLALLVLMGGVLYFAEAWAYFAALEHAPSGLVALLLYLHPGIVTILAWAVLREPLTRARLTALGLAVAGSALTVGPVEGASATGVALGIAAAAIYAVYIVLGAKLAQGSGPEGPGASERVDPMVMSTVVVTAAAASFGGVAMIRGVSLPETGLGWVGIGLLAVVSTVVAITAYLAGLARIGAVRASTLSTWEALGTVLIGAALLSERLTLLQIVGGALILAAAVMTARASRK